MSYAQWRAATGKLDDLLAAIHQARAELRASLPFLGDDIFVLIAAELDARMLGRLGCAAQRFWRASVPDPAHTAEDAGAPELWSVAEEGARRRLAAQSEQVRGWGGRGGAQPHDHVAHLDLVLRQESTQRPASVLNRERFTVLDVRFRRLGVKLGV